MSEAVPGGEGAHGRALGLVRRARENGVAGARRGAFAMAAAMGRTEHGIKALRARFCAKAEADDEGGGRVRHRR